MFYSKNIVIIYYFKGISFDDTLVTLKRLIKKMINATSLRNRRDEDINYESPCGNKFNNFVFTECS